MAEETTVRTISVENTDASNLPDAKSVAVTAMEAHVEIVRDVRAGTLRMREKKEKYLPKFEMEEQPDYDARRQQAVLYNAFRRTVSGLVGMVFRRDPVLGDDVPKQIVNHWENIDLTGRHGVVFCRDVFDAAINDGHACILVDWQKIAPGQLRSATDERRFGARPYWVDIRKEQILRFATDSIGGYLVLTRFAYTETVTEPDGEFGETTFERVRDYQLKFATLEGDKEPSLHPFFSVWEKRVNKDRKEVWVRVDSGWMSISRIPVTVCYTNRTGYLTSDPPLLDLALENIDHYQVRSDRKHALHIAGVPIPVLVGYREPTDESGETKQPVGPNRAIVLEHGGSAEYLESTGASLDHSRTELQDIEQRMAALGLAMLQRQTRSAETAEARQIDKSESDSQLMMAARGLQDCIEEALGFHAEWLREQKGGGSCDVNKDFVQQELSPQMIQTLSAMVGELQLPLEELWDFMVRGGILPDSFDPKKARVLLENMLTEPVSTTDDADAPEDEDDARSRDAASRSRTGPELDDEE